MFKKILKEIGINNFVWLFVCLFVMTIPIVKWVAIFCTLYLVCDIVVVAHNTYKKEKNK